MLPPPNRARSNLDERNDAPWLPVMGEFHFTRFPCAYWEEELLKMKAAGVTIVASYILWNHVELSPGRIDWSGDRDIRRFVTLCQNHGLLFFLRPGPWGHAEARFGGIPDWIVAGTRPRSNDPAYMVEVERFWRSLHDQVRGLFWKDGGPIIGMQIENEYNLDGPGQGRAHIAALKSLALKLGYDVPLYTVTGWDQTLYPKGEVVPVTLLWRPDATAAGGMSTLTSPARSLLIMSGSEVPLSARTVAPGFRSRNGPSTSSVQYPANHATTGAAPTTKSAQPA